MGDVEISEGAASTIKKDYERYQRGLDATIADTISQEMKDSFPSCLVISDPSNNDEPTQETYACCDREQECGPDSDAPLSPVSAPNKKRNWVRLATLVLLEPGSLREAIGLVNNQAKHTQCFLSIWDPNRLEDGVGSAVNQTKQAITQSYA